MKKIFDKELESFYSRAKYLLSINTEIIDRDRIRELLSDSFSSLSNGLYNDGIRDAEVVVNALNDTELKASFDRMKVISSEPRRE